MKPHFLQEEEWFFFNDYSLKVLIFALTNDCHKSIFGVVVNPSVAR
jgi:hypothetical protein